VHVLQEDGYFGGCLESIAIDELSDRAQMLLKLILLPPDELLGSWMLGDVQKFVLAIVQDYVNGNYSNGRSFLRGTIRELRFAKKNVVSSGKCGITVSDKGSCVMKPKTQRRMKMREKDDLEQLKELAKKVELPELRKYAKELGIKTVKKTKVKLLGEVLDEIAVRYQDPDEPDFDDDHELVVWNNSLFDEPAGGGSDDSDDVDDGELVKAKEKAAEARKGKKSRPQKRGKSGEIMDAVLNAVAAADTPLNKNEIIEATGLSDGQVRNALYKLKVQGKIASAEARGRFVAA